MTCTWRGVVALVLLFVNTGCADKDATCNLEGATCHRPRASLLQKDFRHEQKSKLAQEQEPGQFDAACSEGTTAQDRCWYLSKLGESCSAACCRYGRSVSYVLADPEAPLIPKLVGHIPSAKQEAWAAFECYAPSEDRYHTANSNAAKHILDGDHSIGSWSHEACALSCPCGGAADASSCVPTDSAQTAEPAASQPASSNPWPVEPVQTAAPAPTDPADIRKLCSWEQRPECSKQFEYKGVEYTGCATVDNPTPWCSLNRKHQGEWTACARVCTTVATPAPTKVATTPAPVLPEDPCATEPGSDEIGGTASLDEAGYKITTATDSHLNMKRFICRTVAKIGCKVADLAPLLAFVPYELSTQMSYQHLQGELTVVCHSRGKWVVPLVEISDA